MSTMWSAIRWLVLRFAAIRWLFKLGWLGALIPVALMLKSIGLPLLIVLGVVGIPVLFLLFLFGLPIILVLAFGGLFLGLLGVGLMVGLAALKFAIFVVLPIWLIWRLSRAIWCWGFKRRGGTDGESPTPPPPPSSGPAPGADAA
jgi:hypothetical protein